jgi:uncharacterized protein
VVELVHLVALSPLDIVADLGVLLVHAPSYPWFVAGALVSFAVRVVGLAGLTGGISRGHLVRAACFLTQRQIARAVGRSQPEVSRLLRFQPTSPKGRVLAQRRAEVLRAAADAGFRDVRVFGSVVRGQDGPDSDLDFLVTPPPEATLLDLGAAPLKGRSRGLGDGGVGVA